MEMHINMHGVVSVEIESPHATYSSGLGNYCWRVIRLHFKNGAIQEIACFADGADIPVAIAPTSAPVLVEQHAA